jgi:hypothetical protein
MSKLRDLLSYVASMTPNKIQQESFVGYKNVVPLIVDATLELDEMEKHIKNLEEELQAYTENEAGASL